LLWYVIQHPGLQDSLWPAPHEQTWMMVFIYVAVVGSLMVSYTKARAEGLGIECKTGLLARPERVIILAIGLLTNTGIWALALLALFSNVTAVERMVAVWRKTRQFTVEQAGQAHKAKLSTRPPDTGSDHQPVPTNDGTNDVQDSDVRSVPTSVPPYSGGGVKREETA
jgi:CDP-diacylglycerol---glycerol-3-phosphate 3-phosphatidyltransferase